MAGDDFSFRTWEAVVLPADAPRTMLLTFDLEECEKFKEKKPEEQNFPDPMKKGAELDMFSLSYQGALTILDILKTEGVSATFFTTLSFAARYPPFIKLLQAEGHEIALHAYQHDDGYREMWGRDPEECRQRLEGAKLALEGILGEELKGFRPPQLSSPPPALIRELGFLYDSSLHPTYVPGRYNHLGEKRVLCRKDGLYEVPISVSPLLRLPFSWFWFRNLGPGYAKLCTAWTMRSLRFCNIYFHPWDFYPLTRFEFISGLYKRNTDTLPDMFQEYIRWCKGRGYVFDTVAGWLETVTGKS